MHFHKYMLIDFYCIVYACSGISSGDGEIHAT